jgi:Uma2 family endonuclease
VPEYFAYLHSIEGKAEYFDGVICDMTGGSPNHSLITMNCGIAMGRRLDVNTCRVYSGDLHVGIDLANSYVFPDLTVACGQLELSASDPNVAKNPQVIVEVLSASTMERDRTGKLIRYMQIPSLREYLLIEQSRPRVDVCFINANGLWDLETVEGLDNQAHIRSLGIAISMAEIYGFVTFAD